MVITGTLQWSLGTSCLSWIRWEPRQTWTIDPQIYMIINRSICVIMPLLMFDISTKTMYVLVYQTHVLYDVSKETYIMFLFISIPFGSCSAHIHISWRHKSIHLLYLRHFVDLDTTTGRYFEKRWQGISAFIHLDNKWYGTSISILTHCVVLSLNDVKFDKPWFRTCFVVWRH